MEALARTILVALVALASGLALGAFGCWSYASMHFEVKRLEAVVDQERATAKLREDLKPIEAAQAKADAAAPVKVVTATKVVEKIVEKPIYRNVCLDEEGVDYINKIVSGAAP